MGFAEAEEGVKDKKKCLIQRKMSVVCLYYLHCTVMSSGSMNKPTQEMKKRNGKIGYPGIQKQKISFNQVLM